MSVLLFGVVYSQSLFSLCTHWCVCECAAVFAFCCYTRHVEFSRFGANHTCVSSDFLMMVISNRWVWLLQISWALNSRHWIVEKHSQFSSSLGESGSVGRLFWIVLTAAFVSGNIAEMCGGSWILMYTDTKGSGIFSTDHRGKWSWYAISSPAYEFSALLYVVESHILLIWGSLSHKGYSIARFPVHSSWFIF